jgi:hypothetical protein
MLKGSYFLRWLTLLLIGVVVACQPATVVVVTTPGAAESGFVTYRHPSGAFTLRLPPDWSIRDVSQNDTLRVEFSPPANDGLPLTVYILNTGQVMDTPALLEQINLYQKVFSPVPGQYTEIARNAQGDGSWRVVGVRQTPIGARQLNTFLQGDKTFLSVIEIDITEATEPKLALLRLILNSYQVDSGASLSTQGISAINPVTVADESVGSVSFSGLLDWSDASGGFNINGLLTNQVDSPIEAVRVTALIYDSTNRLIAEQPDVLPNEVIGVGESVPFTIRFQSGKPAGATRYELQAAARHAEYNLPRYLGETNFIKGNEKATYNAQGFLVVSGDVVNQTQQPAKAIRVTVTLFDDQNRVVGAETAFVAKPELLPGEVSRFEVTFFQLAGNASRFVTRIEGRN